MIWPLWFFRPHRTTIVAFSDSKHLTLSELAEVLVALPQDAPVAIARIRPHNKGEIRQSAQICSIDLRSQLLRAHEEGHLPGGDWEITVSALGKRLIAHHDGVFWLESLD